MLQVLLLLPEAAARAALDRHRLRLQALRPGADGAGGGLVDVSAGLQRPPSPLPQTGPFPAASPPLLLACVLRGAISTDPTPISHRSRPFSRCTNPGPHGARCDLAHPRAAEITPHRARRQRQRKALALAMAAAAVAAAAATAVAAAAVAAELGEE